MKSIKSAAKEAKMRLKSRFWEDYKREVSDKLEKAKEEGLAPSKIEKYFRSKVIRSVKGTKEEDEKFYLKVQKMMDEYGKPSDALDRLMDKEYFLSLKYDERERYLFELSAKYLSAVERYERERVVELSMS